MVGLLSQRIESFAGKVVPPVGVHTHWRLITCSVQHLDHRLHAREELVQVAVELQPLAQGREGVGGSGRTCILTGSSTSLARLSGFVGPLTPFTACEGEDVLFDLLASVRFE